MVREPGPWIGVAMIGGVVALMGFLVCDVWWATRDYREGAISDRRHVPGHFKTVCTTDTIESGDVSIPIVTCDEVWQAPTWTVWYTDEEGVHQTSVNEGTYHRLPPTTTVYVTFWRGYYTGGRYGERFDTSLAHVEGKW